jgi:hypothetical protein
MIYDIYLLQLGFSPVTVVGKLVQKYERDSYVQKEKQYTKQQQTEIRKIESKHTKQDNKLNKNVKKRKSSD